MSKPNLTRERIADMIQALDAAWIQAQENGWHQGERELLFQTRQLLAALTPPETLEECEAIVGEAVDREGSNYPWMEYLPNEFEFRGWDEVARLREAQRAVVVNRLTDAGVIP